MDPERQEPAARAPLDDAALAALVHDVADGWSMPPQRLDALTWRDRVGRGRRSSGGGGSGIRWTRRLFGAATLAVVATVSLSFAAVWLTGPRSDQGASGPSASASAAPGAPSASPGTSPTVSVPPAGTPLPQLARNGPLPDPSSVMVRTGGGFRVADLATGTLGPAVIGQYNGPTKVLARPGGGWVCLCGDWTQRTAGDPNGLRLTLEVVDATGAAVERRVLKELNGTLDPTEVRSVQPQLVDVSLMGTDDGQYAVIGTVRRDGATGWVLAIDMLDLSTLEIMGTHSLTLAEPMAHDGRARTRLAPVATLSPSGDTLLLTDMWYDDTGPSGPLVGGVDHWIGRSDGGATDPTSGEVRLVPAGSSSWADCSEIAASAADGGTYRTACVAGSGRVTVAHFRADGTTVDSTELPQEANVDGLALTAQTANALFIWDPAAAVMTRYDFGTGKVTTEQGQVAAAPPDVLDTIAMVGRRMGSWIAPSALAKVFLQPGIVVSPDGTRIYALGVEGVDEGSGGSAGVFVFDATTLAQLGHWAPQADMASIGISADGRYLYGAAVAGVDAAGHAAPENGSSITVYDTATGEVVLLAGQLGEADLLLSEPTVR